MYIKSEFAIWRSGYWWVRHSSSNEGNILRGEYQVGISGMGSIKDDTSDLDDQVDKTLPFWIR